MTKLIKFQKDSQKIKLLPYGEELDEEAYQKLREIKTHFASSILLREIKVSLIYWNARINWYVELYGLKFTKEDHVLFVEILYDLITHPDITLSVIPSLSSTLISLLRKRRFLIPGDDLVLPWRPLYNICKRVFWCSKVRQTILSVNHGIKSDLECVVNLVRYYFPPEATQEILDEIRPYLCLFDGKAMKYGIQMLSIFLPLNNQPELADITHKLWFDEIMKIWNACSNNCFFWEDNVLFLMSSLAWLNVGNIDWEDHYPLMYSRFLRMFKLPVYYKKTSTLKMSKISEDAAASWIVSTLGGGSKSQDHLDQLLKILESYCHPANSGYWVSVIKSFLKKLSRSFIYRVKRERFGKISWETKIPADKKLSNEDIERFVLSMQSICMQAMFSPSTLVNFVVVFNDLATLRPDIIVPPLLDTLYSTIDSLNEPYKLLATLQNMCGVARPMVTGGFSCSYDQGKSHVIPLLFAVLPGIDPNDIKKSVTAMQFICTMANMVPIVDCSLASAYYSDLTPEEEELARATAQFEEFVIQFFDRIFLVIDSMVQENVRIENNSSDDRNKVDQNITEMMWVLCYLFVGQLSKSIFSVTLKKLYNYATTKIFEREVAGPAVASLIKGFAKINGEETFKLFLPKLCTFIIEAAKNQNIKEEEILDDELLYNMMLLSEIVFSNAEALKPYIPTLLEILDLTLHLKCKEGYENSSKLLNHILFLYSNISPLDFRSSTCTYDDISQCLPLREWGKSVNINSLDIKWFRPQETEIALVEQIFWRYLIPELEQIDKYLSNELSRENLRCTLNIIFSLLACGTVIEPLNSEPAMKFFESKVPTLPMNLNIGVYRYIRMPDGSNIYKTLIEKMAVLQDKLLKETDDATSFMILVKIWSDLLYYDEPLETDWKIHKERVRFWKSFFENRLIPSKRNIRFMLIEEMAIKHMHRELVCENDFTETHKIALMKLFDLALIEYKLVQVKAQRNLNKILRFYFESSVLLKDKIVENLKEDNKFSEKFKSTLAIIKGQRKKEWPLMLQSYESLKDILPALIKSIPNEEPMVVKLLGDITDVLVNNASHSAFTIRIPEGIIEKTKKLWTHSEIELLHGMPSEEEIKNGCIELDRENEKDYRNYKELMKLLLDAAQSNELHWRYELMAVTFLALFLDPDEPLSIEVVRYFLKLLLNESIQLRKIAIKCVVCIMKTHKPKALKVKVDPYSINGGQIVNNFPGHRADNEWCQYTIKNIPQNENQWNELRYTYSCYIGYYCWPKELYLHSSSSVQPMNNLTEDQFTEINREIHSFFSNQFNVDTLMRYLSLEENKGESLGCFKIALFKYLFKVYSDRYVDLFKPHLERLIDDPQDSHQKCAAEMLAGIIQGAKLWNFDKTKTIMAWCAPLLKKSLGNITAETLPHWGTAIASALYNYDVNKSHYLLEAMMDEPIKGDAAYKDCGRLFALQGSGFFSWRLADLWNKLLEEIKPHLANQYQNLRERLGSVLVSIFETDIEIEKWNRTLSPHVSDFIEYVLPKLEILDSVAPNSKSIQVYPPHKKVKIDNNSNNSNGDGVHFGNEKDVEEAIQLLKTVCKWCTYSIQRCVYTMKPEFFKIFPLICHMENYVNDEELKKICKGTLSLMSVSIILSRDIPIFLEVAEKVSNSNSWCAKCTGLDFLQVFVFHNVFIVSCRQEWISRILSILTRLLEDERCEVRQKAGEVISGFIHYNIIRETRDLLNKFKKMRRKPLNKKNNLNIRHAGVIGLCSFINAYPYTVPPEVPELFVEIRDHLSDPEPIPSTIRRTLGNFKRTHYADWHCLKTLFTADQLDIFVDISVPPNHYA